MYERGLLEMYKAWKAQKLEKRMDTNILNLFETNPTEEQLMLISNIMREKDQYTSVWLMIAFFGSMILGVFIGLLVGVGST